MYTWVEENSRRTLRKWLQKSAQFSSQYLLRYAGFRSQKMCRSGIGEREDSFGTRIVRFSRRTKTKLRSETMASHMDENLLAAALCFWNSASNTFDFRVGPMTPTLLDMAQIFGFRPHGRPVDVVGDYHRRKNQEKLSKPFTISPSLINHNCYFSNFLRKFSAEKDKDQQQMLFLLYWLNRFIFPNRSSTVLLEYRHLAEALHNHTDVGLGPTVLTHLFKNLHIATLENPLNLPAPDAFWMI
ncbi:hypothetical protein L3X38_040691 [Prunus dulcis]|uniref:Aminotransferase-like plant mobile domain-containing protein n=1 Tax=Prunus dulcis TaxID=3755 RepID=A0AAD4VAL2_PRUDU|nr:hypothetical protein L3X38_040691 [Prunus dulcis]